MSKSKKKRASSRSKPINSARTLQREALFAMREELSYFHDLSILSMVDKGILPPFYGGDPLDDMSEVLPLWGMTTDGDEVLGMVMLRTLPDAEPNRSLRELREGIELTNDMPVSELLGSLRPKDQPLPIEGADMLKGLHVALALPGEQIRPAPGYDKAAMLVHIGDEKPYAIFVHVPTTGDEEMVDYLWDDLDNFRAEVVFETTPEALEAAVWHYRLSLAIADEQVEQAAAVEAGIAPDEGIALLSVAELTADFDIMIMHATRLYGSTSPIRSKQEALDVIRTEDGELIVRAPLKAEIEPVLSLAEMRADLVGNADGIILQLDTEAPPAEQIWPQIRVHPYFCLRIREGVFTMRGGQPRIDGFSENNLLEWIVADSLLDMYRLVTLQSLRQFLVVIGRIHIRDVSQIIGSEADTDSDEIDPEFSSEPLDDEL